MKRRVIAIACVSFLCFLSIVSQGCRWSGQIDPDPDDAEFSEVHGIEEKTIGRSESFVFLSYTSGARWILNRENGLVVYTDSPSAAEPQIQTMWNREGEVVHQQAANVVPAGDFSNIVRQSPPWWPHPPLIDLTAPAPTSASPAVAFESDTRAHVMFCTTLLDQRHRPTARKQPQTP